MKDQKLEELKTSIASLQGELKQLNAAMADIPMEDKVKEHLSNMYNAMYRMNDAVYSYVDRVSARLSDHIYAGHLPPIKSPGKMNKALKALGIDDDYEVGKHYVSCASKNNYVIEAEIPSDK